MKINNPRRERRGDSVLIEPVRGDPPALGSSPKAGQPDHALSALADYVRKQTEETRTLDGAREFTLLLGGHCGDAARHDLASLGDVTHQQLGILVVDFGRVRTRERTGLAAAEKRTACTCFGHDAQSSIAAAGMSASSRGRRGPRSPRKPPPSRSPRKPPSRSPRKPPPRSSRSRSTLRNIAEGPSSCSSTRTVR